MQKLLKLFSTAFIVSSLLVIIGCGQQGDLYWPEDQAVATSLSI